MSDQTASPIVTRIERPSRRVSDGLVVGCASGSTLHLPTTAAVVWDRLSSPKTIDELEQSLAEAYPDISNDEITAAVAAIVERLTEAGLVHD